ncbi:hypothetical protein AB395_00001722 [Sinorhizobium fredii CCBAU 45436]|nr:hypothetical protein AB395_00001722 [Sinorhizobium fredii CCBAU 45436]
MHDRSDVDTPPTSSLALPGLTGSAAFPSVDRMTRAPAFRRSQRDSGRPSGFEFPKIKNAGRPAFLQNT